MQYAAAWIVLALLVSIGGCQSAPVTRSGDVVALSGTVHDEKFFGPPNYGENPEIDQTEQAMILRLDQPFTFRRSDGASVVVSEIQLIGFKKVSPDAHVSYKGQLDEAVSGHHRRDVLLCGS